MEYSIKEQFRGKRVLLTGATGYLGSLVLEALLRTTDVAAIYVLLRPTHTQTAPERLSRLLSKNIFHKVRDQQSLVSKVQAIKGDLSLPDLGLDLNEQGGVLKSINVILHSAADIRLEIGIHTSLKNNYLGTAAILNIAAAMPKLAAMVHVSSAFVNMNQPRSSIIEEKLYPLHYGTRRVDAQELVQELLALSPAAADDRAEALTKRWGFPNNYTFGKHLTEQLVDQYHKETGLPVAIVRPSLVCAVAFEPIPGYTGNWAGPIGAAAAMATGLYHSLKCVSSQPLHVWDVVPGDMVAGVVLATAAAVAAGMDSDIVTRAAAAAGPQEGPQMRAVSGSSSSGATGGSCSRPLLVVHACSSSTYPMTLMEGWNHAVEFMAAHPPKFRISRGQLPRMTPDFVPRPEVVRRERRWTAFKVRLLCSLLRLFGLRSAAQRLANGFQALCVYGTSKTDKDLIFTSDALEMLEKVLKSSEHQEYLLVWRSGVSRAMGLTTASTTAASTRPDADTCSQNPSPSGEGGEKEAGKRVMMNWQQFNYSQLAGLYSVLYRTSVPSRTTFHGPNGLPQVVEHHFKYIK